MTPGRLEPATLWSRAKHSTTEPTGSLYLLYGLGKSNIHKTNLYFEPQFSKHEANVDWFTAFINVNELYQSPILLVNCL